MSQRTKAEGTTMPWLPCGLLMSQVRLPSEEPFLDTASRLAVRSLSGAHAPVAGRGVPGCRADFRARRARLRFASQKELFAVQRRPAMYTSRRGGYEGVTHAPRVVLVTVSILRNMTAQYDCAIRPVARRENVRGWTHAPREAQHGSAHGNGARRGTGSQDRLARSAHAMGRRSRSGLQGWLLRVRLLIGLSGWRAPSGNL